MLVCKYLGDLCGPFYVLIELFVKKRLCAKCLYTSIWAICVPHLFSTLLFTYQLAVDFKPGVPLIHGRHMHRQHERAAGVPWKCNDLVRCIDLTFSRRAQCKASS